MMAVWSPNPSSTCRSTALQQSESCPPGNHFTNGGLELSRTLSHFRSQTVFSAIRAQYSSGFSRDWCSSSWQRSLWYDLSYRGYLETIETRDLKFDFRLFRAILITSHRPESILDSDHFSSKLVEQDSKNSSCYTQYTFNSSLVFVLYHLYTLNFVPRSL